MDGDRSRRADNMISGALSRRACGNDNPMDRGSRARSLRNSEVAGSADVTEIFIVAERRKSR